MRGREIVLGTGAKWKGETMKIKRGAGAWRIPSPPVVAAVVMALLIGTGARSQQAAPLTLKQAVSMALQNSRDLSLARLQLQVLQRAAGVTRSQFLPNLYAGSGAAYSSGFPLAAGGGAPSVFSVTYQESLFDPLARSDVRVAQENAAKEQLQVESVRDGVIVSAASSYLELAKVRRELNLLHGERDSAQKILDFIRQRSEAGFELPIEVTRAQLTAARVDQRIAHLESQDDLLADRLRTQLGLADDQAVDVGDEDLPAGSDQAVDKLVAQALQNNVELKQAVSERTADADHLKGERGSRWPTLQLTGQYNLLARFNDYDTFFKAFRMNNVIAGVQIKVPIFASTTSASISLARANFQAADMAVENKRAQISSDVRQKARQEHELQMGVEVARLELDLAQQNLQVLQSQFQQGRASVRDMESAQLDENDKWLSFLDADFARQQAQLDLLRTTGDVAQLAQ